MTNITDEGGSINYPFYWSSITHVAANAKGDYAVYIAFGEALGFMTSPRDGNVQLMDVHGAGSQRSDPKNGDASQYPQVHRP